MEWLAQIANEDLIKIIGGGALAVAVIKVVTDFLLKWRKGDGSEEKPERRCMAEMPSMREFECLSKVVEDRRRAEEKQYIILGRIETGITGIARDVEHIKQRVDRVEAKVFNGGSG